MDACEAPYFWRMQEEGRIMDEEKSVFRPVVTVRAAKKKVFFGPGVVMLLTQLEVTGSIKEACRVTGLSYSKAWKILNTAEEECGYPLVSRRQGGKSGGGCIVTPEGKELLAKYLEAEKKIKQFAKQVFDEVWSDMAGK